MDIQGPLYHDMLDYLTHWGILHADPRSAIHLAEGMRQEVDLDVGSLGSRLKVAELVDTLNDLVQAARDKDEDITVYLNKARTTFSHLRARMADAKLGRDSRWFDYELELAKHAALAVIRNKLKCAEANDVNVQGLDCTAYMTAVGEVLISQGTAATAEQEAMERYRRQKAHENLRDIFAEGMEGVVSVMKLNALLHENELSTLMANIMTLCRHLDDSLDKPRLPMIYGRGLKGRASSAQKRSKAAAAAAAAATAAADGLAAPLLPTVAAAAAGTVKKRGADETETDDEAKGGGGKGKGKAKRPRAEGEAGVPPTPDEAKRLRAAREAAEAVVHNRRGLSTVEQALAEAPSPARPVAVQKRLKLRRSTKENVKNAKAKASPPSQRKRLKRAGGAGSSAESDDGYASSSSSNGAVVVVSVKRNGPLDWASHSDSEFESDELVEEEDDEEPEFELEPEEAEESQGGAAEVAEGGGGAEGEAGLGAPETPVEGGKALPPPQKRITLSRSPGEQVDWTDSQSVDEPLASPAGAAGAIARMGEAQAPGERWVKPLKKTVASGSRGRRFWTKEEEGYLRDGVKIYGEGRWAVILEAYPFENRTSVNLKDKWRNITKSDAAMARASAAQDAAANGDGGGGLTLLGDGSAPPALRPLAPRVLLPGIGLPLTPSPLQLGAAPGAAAGFAPPPLLPQQPPQQQQGLEPPEGGGGAAEGAGAGDGVAPLGMSAAGASNIAQV